MADPNAPTVAARRSPDTRFQYAQHVKPVHHKPSGATIGVAMDIPHEHRIHAYRHHVGEMLKAWAANKPKEAAAHHDAARAHWEAFKHHFRDHPEVVNAHREVGRSGLEDRPSATRRLGAAYLSAFAEFETAVSHELAGKMEKTMHEFKHGELHSGTKDGPKVKSRKQAIAIGLSQARKAGELSTEADFLGGQLGFQAVARQRPLPARPPAPRPRPTRIRPNNPDGSVKMLSAAELSALACERGATMGRPPSPKPVKKSSGKED